MADSAPVRTDDQTAPDAQLDIEAAGLITYVDASPSPFHACEQAGERLAAAGFLELDESDAWPREGGRYYTIRGGSLVAWTTEHAAGPATGFRVVGAHTDSPNLRIKPQPDGTRAGWRTLGVEVYGGPLLNSWLDRDLGLSGRVAVRQPDGVALRTFRIDDPILRVAQLAIHLDRDIVEQGVRLNKQQHLAPIWGTGDTPGDFAGLLAETVGCERDDVLGWDAMTHDLTGARRIGPERELIAAPRLDNLGTSYAGVRAMVRAASDSTPNPRIPVLVLFDHEENGSMSDRGAFSTLLPSVLERIVAQQGGEREDYWRALAATVIASGDMAHATHPHYPDRHEPDHWIRVNGGPVLKINNGGRYATDAGGAAAFALACEQAGVPVQRFVVRSDLPSGGTVGPMTAALTGATTVDFGAPMLSMHSARELCGAHDPAMYVGALAAFLAPQQG